MRKEKKFLLPILGKTQDIWGLGFEVFNLKCSYIIFIATEDPTGTYQGLNHTV